MVLQSGKTLMTIYCRMNIEQKCTDCLKPKCLQKNKQSKRSNRGLATFDKINYFPLNFVDSHMQIIDKEKRQGRKGERGIRNIV